MGLPALLASVVAIGTGNIRTGATAGIAGAALYVGALTKELETTGRVMPFPFFSTDIGAIARSATTTGETSTPLTEVDYLTLTERSKLAMGTTLKPLAMGLESLEPQEQAVAYHMLVNGMATLYPGALEQVAVLPALLPDMGGLAGVRSQLTQMLPPMHQQALASADLPETIHPAELSAPSIKHLSSASPTKTKKRAPKPAEVRVSETTVAMPPEVEQPQQKPADLAVTALQELIDSPSTSLAWFGSQRTGKSYLAALASRKLHEADGTRVFHINLASYGDEDGYYWEHVQQWDSVCCDISGMDLPTGKQQISAAIQLVNDFYACENALLIIDEFAYIGSKTNAHADTLAPLLHVIADKISTLASTGKKRGKALWALSPEFVASSLVKDALSVKKLGLVFCAIAPGHKACWKNSKGKDHSLSFDWSLYNMVSNNFSIDEPPSFSPHARTVYINGQWIATGVKGDEL